ncbi:unnamed protein product [Bursaphelenchus xylophilus]|uniref:(pine wood nematode) hypothetical protein n=1 Tax=Bursaphelenchus xylophilus TaxID=6326 RepID=A0A1I7RHM0_BURXY|nr:unnamed protein product [Bursaphelenchus xylophilus]CAG9115602.1 unnamed protein product [Bursaphelenchus xylophilus]
MTNNLGRQFLGWWLKCPSVEANLNDTGIGNGYGTSEMFKSNPLAQIIYSFVLAMIFFYILLLLRNFYFYFFYPVWQMRPVSTKKRRSRSRSKIKSDIEMDVRTAVLQSHHHEVKMNEPVPLVYKRRRSNVNGYRSKDGNDLISTKTARSPHGSPRNSRCELSTLSSSNSKGSLTSLSSSFETSSTLPSSTNGSNPNPNNTGTGKESDKK